MVFVALDVVVGMMEIGKVEVDWVLEKVEVVYSSG